MSIDFRPKTGERRLRFLRNTSYAGADYGPDYPEQVAVVAEDWARQFLRAGRAVEEPEAPTPPSASAASAASAAPSAVIETRDPEAMHRDPASAKPRRPKKGK